MALPLPICHCNYRYRYRYRYYCSHSLLLISISLSSSSPSLVLLISSLSSLPSLSLLSLSYHYQYCYNWYFSWFICSINPCFSGPYHWYRSYRMIECPILSKLPLKDFKRDHLKQQYWNQNFLSVHWYCQFLLHQHSALRRLKSRATLPATDGFPSESAIKAKTVSI